MRFLMTDHSLTLGGPCDGPDEPSYLTEVFTYLRCPETPRSRRGSRDCRPDASSNQATPRPLCLLSWFLLCEDRMVYFFFETGKIKVERSLAGGLMIMLEAAEFRASSAPGLPPHSLRSPSLIWQLRGLRALPACFSVLPDDI